MIEVRQLEVRTRHILGLAATGMTNGEIANHLGVSHHEVDRHVREAIRALSARSRLEAAVLALRLGLIHSTMRERGHMLSVVEPQA